MGRRWLIAVMTCHGLSYVSKANAQRNTWVLEARKFADVLFFRGRHPYGEQTPYMNDEVWLDVDDTYAGIPAKVHAIFSWASQRNYDYISKCDDDVYCVPQRLEDLPLKGDYVGRFRGPCGGYPAAFASGFFYSLSPAGAALVAAQSPLNDWMDERYIGNLLASRGICGWDNGASYVVSGPHIKPKDVPNRYIIKDGTVFCQYGPKEIREMHETMGHLSALGHYELEKVKPARVSFEQLSAKPTDKAPERPYRV